jgi:hypothetical protein
MVEDMTTVAGFTIPSADRAFLFIVALHIPLGVLSVVTGAIAMLSPKAPGRHPTFGTIYFCSVVAIFLTATALSLMRWSEDYHLFVLGTLTMAAAYVGRRARRRRRPGWIRLHVVAMGTSYVLLLTAFYVDNGKQLPLWRELPVWSYWTLPALIGAPLMIRVLLKHPVVKQLSNLNLK